MARFDYSQTNFLGGEISPRAQGRVDKPEYRSSLVKSRNMVVVEEGAHSRRRGTHWIKYTRGRAAAKLLPFIADTIAPMVMEVTNGSTEFIIGTSPLFTNGESPGVTAASYDTQFITVTLTAVPGAWAGGDILYFFFPAGFDPTLEAGMRGRQVYIRSIVGSNVTLSSDRNGEMLGLTFNTGALVGTSLYKVRRVATVWDSTQIATLQTVQAEDNALVLDGTGVQPPQKFTLTTLPSDVSMAGIEDRLYMVTADANKTNYAVEILKAVDDDDDAITSASFSDEASVAKPISTGNFTVAAATFRDGPYQDAYLNGTVPMTCTVSAYAGAITVTAPSAIFPDTSFVGQHIRLFSEPPAWASGTTYAYGDVVTYNGQYWISVVPATYTNLNRIPNSMPLLITGVGVIFWAPAINAQRWAWGIITAVPTTSTLSVTLQTSLPSINGATMAQFRLGLFKSGQYPTTGVYHDGRLWLGGAVSNRVDSSNSNDFFGFSPTDAYGVVADNHSISGTFNADSRNKMYWMASEQQGIVVGTTGGEFLISASAGDSLTPFTADANKITPYKMAQAVPVKAGLSLVFIQKFKRKIYEYLADTFSGRFSGKPINENAMHMSTSGVEELAYTEEPTPIIWARMGDGSLCGCTFRRVSRLVSENPVFNAWHKHIIGGDADV